jgi:hypothetical protein
VLILIAKQAALFFFPPGKTFSLDVCGLS